MATEKKINVFAFAKLQTVLMALVGLLAGVLYSFGGAIYDLLTTRSVNLGTALAFLALIGMPIVFAVFGFMAGILEAFFYNIFARWFGGIDINIEQKR